MKRSVQKSIIWDVFKKFIAHGSIMTVLVFVGSSGVASAADPSSGMETLTSGTNTIIAAPSYTITNNDNQTVLYVKSSGSPVTLNVSGDVNAVYTQSTAVGHDNYGTVIFANSSTADAATIKVDGNVNCTVSGLAYADITAKGADSKIDITGKVTAITDSRYGAVWSNGGTINMGSADLTLTPGTLTTPTGNNQNSIAISVNNGGSVAAIGEIKIDNHCDFGKGIMTSGAGSSLTAASVDITSNGTSISAGNGSAVTIGGQIKIVNNAKSSFNVIDVSGGSKINAGSFDISLNADAGASTYGACALSAADNGSEVQSAGHAKIVVTKDAAGTATDIKGIYVWKGYFRISRYYDGCSKV